MRDDLQTYGDLADFIERLLRGQVRHEWEIDDFESVPIARRKKDPAWVLELWRLCIIDIVAANEEVPGGPWMHPDSRPQLERMVSVLRYLDQKKTDLSLT